MPVPKAFRGAGGMPAARASASGWTRWPGASRRMYQVTLVRGQTQPLHERGRGAAGAHDKTGAIRPRAGCWHPTGHCVTTRDTTGGKWPRGVIADLWHHLRHLRDHVRRASGEAIHLAVQAHLGMDLVISHDEGGGRPVGVRSLGSAPTLGLFEYWPLQQSVVQTTKLTSSTWSTAAAAGAR